MTEVESVSSRRYTLCKAADRKGDVMAQGGAWIVYNPTGHLHSKCGTNSGQSH